MLYRKILATTDFSKASAPAINHAAALAAATKATLVILHVGPVEVAERKGQATIARTEAHHLVKIERAQQAASQMRKLHRRLGSEYEDLLIETRIVDGTPHEVIIENASDGEVDLLVQGTHGLRGLRLFMIGSTAERIIRTSPVPVLTLRNDEA